MYILLSVDHLSIFSKSLERAWVKEEILFQFALKDGCYRQHIYQWSSCSNVKAYHSQIREIKLDRGLIPAVPLAWQVSDQMLYALVSQTVVVLPDRNQATLCGLARYTDNFFSSRLWLITLNALRKSTNTSLVTSSLSILNKISSVILIRAISVEWPERKADFNSCSKLFSRKYFNSECATCFSMILDRIGSTDMGR